MILLGLILLVLGFVLGISLLWVLGVILLVVGAALLLVGNLGHPVGGRAHWW